MNANIYKKQLYDTETSIKKEEVEAAEYINGIVQITDKSEAADMVKNILTGYANKTLKRKRTKDKNAFTASVDYDQSKMELDERIHQEFEENKQIKRLKLVEDVKTSTRKGKKDVENKGETGDQTEHISGEFVKYSFSSPNALEILKKFVKVCSSIEKTNLAAEYLDSGGSISEVLRLLETTDQKNIEIVITAFSAMRILLIQILAKYPQHEPSAERACRHFINSHLSLIHSMLSLKSNVKRRKVTLQLLATIVSLGGSLPRELLTHLTLSSEIIKFLVQHTKPTDNQNIRNCFIHFILAFLIEGNVPIIRALLDKHNWLFCIFPGLIFDSKDIVVLILTTLKTYILLNPNVSKTMKLQIFSTSVIQNILHLYNWKGPSNWSKHKTESILPSPQYLEEKESIMEIVHDFLILLLTSHRHGVIFHDHFLGTSHIKNNHLVYTVLQSLDRPWEHQRPSNLVIQVMTACPDLIKSEFIFLEPYIAPRVSSKWFAVMKFARAIIQSVDVASCAKMCSPNLNAIQLASFLISVTVPEVLMKQAIMPSLIHSNIIIRHEAILTLMSMINQIKKYLSVIKVVYKANHDFGTFKNFITDLMTKSMPNLNMILKVWSSTFISEDSVEFSSRDIEFSLEQKKDEHLMTILNLLHMYNEVCPKLLDTLSDMQPDTFLKVLDNLDNITPNDFVVIKVKAIQFLVITHPNEFLSHKKIFMDTLSFLISVLNKNTSSMVLSAKITMKTLLNATGLFEGCSDHLDIWINGFINLRDRKIVTKWFISVIKKAVKEIERYVNEVIETEEIINQEVVPVGGLKSLFEELMNGTNIIENVENNALHMYRFTSVSPLLCCIFGNAKEDLHPSILSYLSYILIHTLHYQVVPQCLIHLIKGIQALPAKKYLISWSEGNQPVHLKEIFPSMQLICKLNSILLSDSKLKLSEIFSGNNIVTFHYKNVTVKINHSLTTYDTIHMFKMSTFYLTQFIVRDALTETQHDNYTIFLVSLLHIAKNSSDNFVLVDECARSIFLHPIILHYFSPLKQKNKSLMTTFINSIIVNICNVVINLCEKSNVRGLFHHFKNKFLAQLCKMIIKGQKGGKMDNVQTVITLLGLLQPSSNDVVYLLKIVIKLESSMLMSKDESNLSLYGFVIPKLLNIINNDDMKSCRSVFFELDAEFVRCLCLHLLFLKSNSINNFEVWETALHEYLSEFPHNIAGIDLEIFASLLTTKVTNTTIKLISFLISKDRRFISIFTQSAMKYCNLKSNKFVLPIIASNLKFKWNQQLLQRLKEHYEVDILSYLCNPSGTKSWIEENIIAICYLIENTFDFKICNETCNAILQIGDKLDMVPISYIKLVESLHNTCAELGPKREKFIMDLIHVLLHIITLTLKKESKNVHKRKILSAALIRAVKRLRQNNEEFAFEELNSNHSWRQFARFSLKLGLRVAEEDEESVTILKTLSTLCNIAYKNNSDNEYVKTLFEMATSHSEFINIMLSSSNTKGDLVELLWILVQKNKTVVTLAHVPLYFAAYSATLIVEDQYILSILKYYESNNINIYEYRPYIWGNAAAIHYSVKGETETNIWRQPSIAQVLSLFDRDIVNNTIRNYPVDRELKINEMHGASDIYDPAFYLPLLCFLLSENNFVPCYKVAQSGALALVLVACSSKHSDVRLMAYTIIARYYTHLEASRFKAKLLWMRLIDALRYGVMSQPSNLNDVRVNCLVSTFLARASLIATQPLHPLYTNLQTFLMAKPALDINTIPEFLHLYHSSDVEHKAHRYWMLENIRDSIKTESELDVAFKCVLFKMLLDFYSCNLSDSNTKKLILEIIDVTLKMTRASVLLIEGYGLLPWLLEVARNAYKQEVEHIELIVNIMDKLLNTVLSIKGHVVQYKLMLLNIALCLKLHLVDNIEISTFTLYNNILQKLVLSKQLKVIVTKEHITTILELSKKLLGNIDEYVDILRFGCEFVTKVDCLSNDEIELAKDSLRLLVWTWCIHEEN